MAVKSLTFLVGYVGMTPQYHTIYYETPDKIHPIHKNTFKVQQGIVLSNRMKFGKKHKNRKKSNHYEGTGKNYSESR